MKIYGLKTCDTCRKALKILGQAEFQDVRAQGVPDEVMEQAILCHGENLVNKRSTTWRQLGESERALPVPQLLKQHPTVMKRPLIVAGDDIYLGWTPQVRAALV